jgi:hypothetical protein
VPRHASTRDLPEIADRREEVVRLRAAGKTWAEIAAATGFHDGSGALKAFKAACRNRPSLAVDEYRTQESERLDLLLAATTKQILSPGPRVSAIGKLPVYPPGHPRAGEIVEDESVRSRAIDTARKLSESIRRLHNVDVPAPPTTTVVVNQQAAIMRNELNAYMAARGRTQLPPIPGIAE